MKTLLTGLAVAGALIFGSASALANEPLKIGDRMPAARGEIESQSAIVEVSDSEYQKGVVSINYSSGDTELYLKCNSETILDTILKRFHFAIYIPNGDGKKNYYLDWDFDGKINLSEEMDDGDFRNYFKDAPSCKGKI